MRGTIMFAQVASQRGFYLFMVGQGAAGARLCSEDNDCRLVPRGTELETILGHQPRSQRGDGQLQFLPAPTSIQGRLSCPMGASLDRHCSQAPCRRRQKVRPSNGSGRTIIAKSTESPA